jgi:uncharacterized repeat protein (TIGR01451 family)
LFKNCVTGLVLATLVSTQPSIAQVVDPTVDPPPPPKITNQAQYQYNDPGNPNTLVNGTSNEVIADPSGLIDPLGIITGCKGERLSSYKDFVVGLYNIAPNKLDPTTLLQLTSTVFAPQRDRLPPNLDNINPYPLDPNGEGRYNFLFNQDQIAVGKSYIIIVKVPPGSTYGERRARIEITSFNNGILSYKATSLDGKPLSTTEGATQNVEVDVSDAARVALVGIGVCDNEPAKITKSADRATAEVGDTVVYRIALKNNSQNDILDPIVTDTLPLGMTIIPNSVKAQIYDDSTASLRTVPVTLTKRGDKTCFQIGTVAADALVTSLDSSGLCSSSRSLTTVGAPKFVIPSGKVVDLVYAVTLDTDAIRGTGKNSATLTGISNNTNALNSSDPANFVRNLQDGPANYTLSIRQGLIRDTGTLIGRVFVDKNFDGQQQPNEPGIPNAVIFMDDGNRITTDLNGLFSVQSVVAGYRTGALDLSSLPGYSLAPNLYFSERNSRSRLVKLAPGGIARMNFGVTPTAREVK